MTGAYTQTERSLARIEAHDAELNSCVLVRYEALGEAAQVDRAPAPGPLAGWTVGVKDNTDVAGTVRSDGLGPPSPPPAGRDAEAVARLRAAGAIVVAKTNLEQLSFGATTQNPTWGPCRNPWDRTCIPGGSSGGSAVAVAAGFVDVALGTDTGGSLRNPAAFCGISALRPTHGLVPNTGVTPLSPSMDVVGPIARSVTQLRAVLTVLTAQHATTAARPLAELTFGVPVDYFVDELEPDVARGFDELLTVLKRLGGQLRPVTLAGVAGVPDPMSALQNAEAASSLRAYWDDERLSPGIQARLDLGRSFTESELESARRVMAGWQRTADEALGQVDAIVTPATPFVAPRAGADDLVPLSRRINRFTGCWSPLGVPALAVPLPRSGDGLPVGGQLVAARGGDWDLLAIGEALQVATDWHAQTPPPPA